VRILSEMSELLIAIAALLYVVSNRTMLDRKMARDLERELF
jgi:hypothetical protein